MSSISDGVPQHMHVERRLHKQIKLYESDLAGPHVNVEDAHVTKSCVSGSFGHNDERAVAQVSP